MSTLLSDLRCAARQLRRSPAYALTVVLTLALAAGAGSAMVGVLRATLLHPLPYPEPEKLLTISDVNTRGFKSNGLVTVLRADDLAHARVNGHLLFSDLGYLYSDDSTLSLRGAQPVRISTAAVSGNFFQTVGTQPLLGHTFSVADDFPGHPQLLVLSYSLWHSVFAGDPAIVGRVVHLGTEQATVIGVMPPAFHLPEGAELWHPGHVPPSNFGSYRGDGSRFVQVYGRLAAGQSLPSAVAGTTTLATALARQYPQTDAGWAFQVASLRDSLFGTYTSALLLLTAAVALVLLAAALNITGLQLSRHSTRTTEIAIRSALGSGKGRLLRLLFVETAMLMLLGTLAGLALAPLLLHLIASRLPAPLLQVSSPHLDVFVFFFSLALLAGVGAITALLPAFRSIHRVRAQASGVVGGAVVSGGASWLGSSLVVLQIGLSLMLLAATAGVLVHLHRLLTVPLGFAHDHLVTFTVDLPWNFDPERARHLYLQAEEQFAALPGVEAAGATMAMPLEPFDLRSTHDIAGQQPTPLQDTVVAQDRQITPGYLEAMRIPLLAGRSLDLHDTEPKAAHVVLVNEALVRAYFPNGSALGQQLVSKTGSLEIVGIVRDTQGTGGPLTTGARPEIFYPLNGGWPHMHFALRTALPPASLQQSVRRVVTSLDPAMSTGTLTRFDSLLRATLLAPRLNAGLLSAFAAMSLLLVLIGTYGLVAFQISQRTRELGLRLALGCTRIGVLTLLLRESLTLLLAGLTLGSGVTLLSVKLLRDAITLDASSPALLWLLPGVVLLSGAVLASTSLPARRAALLDPNQALKSL